MLNNIHFLTITSYTRQDWSRKVFNCITVFIYMILIKFRLVCPYEHLNLVD